MEQAVRLPGGSAGRAGRANLLVVGERTGIRPSALRWFYRHLIASVAAQLALVVIALASGGVARWLFTVLLVGALAIAAHATVALRPRTPNQTDRSDS